jgi:hypothetical protein
VGDREPIGFGFGAKDVCHAVVNHVEWMRRGGHGGILTVGTLVKKHAESFGFAVMPGANVASNR